ncbi:MAG: aminoacyl-tRNA hydrolase [candidate division KSB1 bacterium]|nr:aminoacyl-tRNA hydrolase [candidate division KSB1 bacterium]MDZ7302793.1 aminoacyl-tRNA hydrolase [candidate division KSB1 bacterium]MDZ7310042.1 aminoacyl-tRNA hydrolase [candidate division KSB1 bacterium]
MTHLIVGLGNPGSRYAHTRHNVGFKVVERMAERLGLGFRAGKGDYLIAAAAAGAEVKAAILLMKPLTFMNNSGLAVRQAIDYFKVDLPQVLIIFDDYQLPLGKLRLRARGSDGGHNGMASVIQHLGTQEVPRLRIGIGSEFAKGEMIDHVLSPFSKEEQELMPAAYDRAVEAALSFVNDGLEQAMNRFNL